MRASDLDHSIRLLRRTLGSVEKKSATAAEPLRRHLEELVAKRRELELEEFDQASENYVRETLGWEFDLLQVSQRAEEAMRDA